MVDTTTARALPIADSTSSGLISQKRCGLAGLNYRAPLILAGHISDATYGNVNLQQKDILLALDVGRKMGVEDVVLVWGWSGAGSPEAASYEVPPEGFMSGPGATGAIALLYSPV